MASRGLLPVLAGAVIAMALLSSCARLGAVQPGPSAPASSSPSVSASPAPPAPPPPVGTSATATVPRLTVYASLGGPAKLSLTNPSPTGGPLTLLVVQSSDGWLEVDLPTRPNGSRGWISASQVTLHDLVYSIRVSTEANTLSLTRNNTVVSTYPVATGTGGTPTPHGSFYLTELIAPSNPGYGPYAFGLSAFSDVLTSFGGGPGQIGLHGTDDAASIGRAVSHGCIRMSNADITALAALLPLGTPIAID
ncbi:L,D-transpeptidase [Lacisediminihabitans profunda]|uniref:L,D-transpeptidase n=1 Tax=Lacisediminihabitans profunda TaxID=2594790 RepID=A0A5C8UVX7_9MICO|nr:L,D-transpeptidase [Lacisediminihabitans profunda]